MREVAHTICCPPSAKPCNLRFPERANVPGRSTNTDWAAFQLAAHARADVVTAMAELWPETVGLDWEHLSPAQVRALPAPVQALWVVIIRGPGDKERPHVPDDQRQASRFGFLSMHQAERILRRRHGALGPEIATAIDTIVAWLSPWRDVEESLNAAWKGMQCTPRIHVFSVSGDPPADVAPCFCHRYSWLEWQVEQAARKLESR